MNCSEHSMKNNLGILAVVLAASFLFILLPYQVDADEGTFSYYAQLDDNEKAIFDAICAAELNEREINVDLPIKITATGETRENYLVNVIHAMKNNVRAALELSAPMAYWTWGDSKFTFDAVISMNGNTATLHEINMKLDLNPAYDDDPSTPEVNELHEKMDALIKAIDAFSTKRTDKRGIVEDINNYLTGLVTYETEPDNYNKTPFIHDAYGALVSPNRAVCDGYSKAFLLLCEKEGIECLIDQGSALPSTEGHAWNYVKMDNGKWYGIDVTWNDNNDNGYFLLGADTFFSSHMRGTYLKDGSVYWPFNLPETFSKDKYDADPPSYEKYAWIFAILIIALLAFALYRSTKEKW
jgi:Uncharacterized protein involved in cytokinesis, contains TGc (transglutaminase/protease-like) domain